MQSVALSSRGQPKDTGSATVTSRGGRTNYLGVPRIIAELEFGILQVDRIKASLCQVKHRGFYTVGQIELGIVH